VTAWIRLSWDGVKRPAVIDTVIKPSDSIKVLICLDSRKDFFSNALRNGNEMCYSSAGKQHWAGFKTYVLGLCGYFTTLYLLLRSCSVDS
jgi:hypothetical protein